MSNNPTILLDGYNLILRYEKLNAEKPYGLEQARERLLSRLASYRSMKRVSLTVVFDGDDVGVTPRSYIKNGVQVIFSLPPTTADAVIKRIIQSQANPKNITVVTSDRAVADFATKAGCGTLSSEAFKRRLEKMIYDFNYKDKFDHKLSDEEIKEWMSLFNESEES